MSGGELGYQAEANSASRRCADDGPGGGTGGESPRGKFARKNLVQVMEDDMSKNNLGAKGAKHIGAAIPECKWV